MFINHKRRVKNIFFGGLSVLFLFIVSKLMLSEAGIDSSQQAFLLTIVIIFLSASEKAFWGVVFLMSIVYAVYSPIGRIFGKPNYQYLASVFATDIFESKEFLLQLSVINYVYPFLIVFCVLVYRILLFIST